MRRIGDYIIGTLLVAPILAVGLWFMVRDLWHMRRVRWTRGRKA